MPTNKTTIADSLNNTMHQAVELGAAGKVFSAVAGAALAYIAPFQSFLITIVVLVVADLVTGIWSSNKRGEKFEAKRLKQLIGKVILYPLALLLAHVMVDTFFKGISVVDSLTYMVALFICAIEFQSNIENIGSITGIDIWASVKDWLANRMGGAQASKAQP